MLLQNGLRLISAVINNRSGSGGFVPTDMTDMQGETIVPKNNYSMMSNLSVLFSVGNKKLSELGSTTVGTILMGTDDKITTITDYNIPNAIPESDFSILSYSKTSTPNGCILNQQIQYNGANDVTIKELGFVYNWGTSNGSTVLYYPSLIARVSSKDEDINGNKVFAPITLTNNGIYNISIVIG